MSRFTRVSKELACPACGRPDWCYLIDGGSAVVCMREPSDRPCKGGGWAHKVGDRKKEEQFRDYSRLSPVRASTRLTEKECSRMQKSFIRQIELAKSDIDWSKAGIRPTKAREFMVGYQTKHNNLTFPMRCGETNPDTGLMRWPIRGFSCRNVETGQKRCVWKSKAGLIMSNSLARRANRKMDSLFVCEGQTDTLSLSVFSANVVGRVGADSGFEEICKFVESRSVSSVVFMPDNDTKGKHSANRMAERIKMKSYPSVVNIRVCILPEDCNDVRDMVEGGYNRRDFSNIINGKYVNVL